MEPHWIGIALIVVPILVIGAAFLRRPLFLFLVALMAVGIGYLHFTGAAREVGDGVNAFVRKTFQFDPAEFVR